MEEPFMLVTRGPLDSQQPDSLAPDCYKAMGIEGVHTSAYHQWKPVVGRILATILLIPGLPVIAAIMVLVRILSPGPAIYRQLRVGQHGRTFWLYKIRTMIHHAEATSGAVWTQPGDPRVTRIGRILRKLHLDEFPQLFNVLRGEMVLIGPRPERPEFVSILSEQIPGYPARLAVKPGITGLAQINLPPDSDIESVRRKLALDLEYITTTGPMLDTQVMLCTATRLLGLPGDFSMRLFRLQRSICLEKQNASSAAHNVNMADRNGAVRPARQRGKKQLAQANGKSQTNGKTVVKARFRRAK
jgi:lipopolysaccharide/colanic/teichoic acid biosynthesis glycosyltransferase